MFAYLESLVAWGVFAEVYESFLLIGHTHADIDQTFSCTAQRLRQNVAVTMEDLIMELGQAYNPPPTVSRMLHIINFSDWCKKEKCLRKVATFSHFRYLTFHRIEDSPLSERDSFKTSCSVRVGFRD